MSLYESVFIARQDISAAQVDGLTETFEKIINDQGGSVAKTESWGLRTLAYRIKKNRKGYYVLMNIDAPAPAIHEMERQMRINEDVLRYLTTRVDELEEGPSAVLRAKERGDDRGRRGGRDDRRPSHEGRPGRDKEAAEANAGESEAPKDAAEADAGESDAPKDAAEADAGESDAPKDAAEADAGESDAPQDAAKADAGESDAPKDAGEPGDEPPDAKADEMAGADKGDDK